ncbi:MAG: S8 family serine peptidase [Pseudomonadota bacterium]
MKKLTCVIFIMCLSWASANSKIDSYLADHFSEPENEIAKVLIMIDDSEVLDYYTNEINEYYFDYKTMVSMLKYIEEETQKDIRNDLNTKHYNGDTLVAPVKTLWNCNSIVAYVNKKGLAWLTSRSDVQKILLDRDMQIEPGFPSLSPFEEDDKPPVGYTYGLKKIGIDKLNEEMPWLTGEGVLVGVIDSGVDGTHPELEGKIYKFKNMNSSDPNASDDNPVDYHGHGTHVSGTILGGNLSGAQIGVAPGAMLVASAALSGWSPYSNILEAMQWIMDPDGDPETADFPRVVNCSWHSGNAPSQEPFYKAIAAWEAANIVPNFSAGNAGENGLTNPKEFPSTFTVAATDMNDLIAPFSSHGPAIYLGDEFMKPEVSAPGVDIFSSLPEGKYEKWSGTSMAAPHVAGTMALLFQIDPELTVDGVKELLISTSVDLGDEGWDYRYGFGRIDAFAAAAELISRLY